ncbi:SMP-30/gluconolactonase/LRE family protein [Planosporangium thailandense]|uniref:SMP-30/gluconolactonase/LRE family protein n=1 Tax=Planosporangium thailandense TaxID=765197 RepID=A0ABX0Y1Q4_9ACTN|nr:SMP-30/gluconolactonase/LRE family protein [Planosporangium thailandense]NJC71284.1 SMP-30/gluconolactonase/LRE family protein [Planosporangium thailandense]
MWRVPLRTWFLVRLSALVAAVILAVPGTGAAAAVRQSFPPPTGDPRIIRSGARLTMLFDRACGLTTGPAADRQGDVFFADLEPSTRCRNAQGRPQAGVIYRYRSADGRTTVFRSPSGQANGMQFDADGNLVVAESADYGGRRVTRIDPRTGQSVVLADRYQGRPLNSPNGVSIDERGRIYITDPRYDGPEPVDQPVEGIYRIDRDRSIHRIIVNAAKPNGVWVSPDQRTLYVADFDTGFLDELRLTPAELASIPPRLMTLWAYPLHPDGTVGERRALVNYLPRFGPDGITTDVDGNLYVAVRDTTAPGIRVYAPNGHELARIPTGDALPTSAEFGTGTQAHVLYITAGKGLYRIDLNSRGYKLPQHGATASPTG